MNIQTIRRPYEVKERGDAEEIERAVKSMIAAFGDFKTASDGKIAELIARLDEIELKGKRPPSGGTSDPNDVSPELKRAAAAELKNLNHYIRAEFKALTTDYDPQSGYLVPSPLQLSMIEKLYDQPALLSIVRTETWNTAGGEWIEPTRRAMMTARRRGTETEASQNTETDDPFGLLTVPAGESETEIEISQKLLDDSAYDIGMMAVADTEAAFDRQLDAEIVAGTGTGNQAAGFLSKTINTTGDATRSWGQIQYIPSRDVTLVTADGLKDLVYGLRAPYRAGAGFVMSSSTGNAVDKLKNQNDDYIWRDSFAAGQPPTLLGFPVYFDENMPAIASGSFPIAFANWRLAYVVAKKKQTRFLRDPYSKKPNLVLYAYKRQGGDVANSEAIKVMKIGTS